LAQSLAVAGGAGRDERQGPGKAAEAHAYHLLGRAYRNWLATLDPGEPPTLAVRRWRREVRSVALECRRELVNSCPPTAWGGRVDNKEYVDVGSAVAAFDSELAKIAPAEPRPEPGA
jgi:CRISPR system Cascade subunit CasA